jgi:hypothetical protein
VQKVTKTDPVQTNTDALGVTKKNYKKPVLSHYGTVSKLVKSLGGVGTDGGGLPPFTLT